MRIPILISLLSFCIGCSNTKPTSSSGSTSQAKANPAVEREAQRVIDQGVDFYASGSQPSSWKLDIDFDRNVVFTTDDGLTVTMAFNKFKTTTINNETIYTGNSSAGQMMITRKSGKCDTDSRNANAVKNVTVALKNRIYSGCGAYSADKKLNGKWQLEKISNTDINSSEYNRVPAIEIDLSEMRMKGNDGCNSISATIEVQGSRIQFSQVVSTRMACNKKDISAIISKNISAQLVDYYFKEGKLFLYLPDDSKLVFGRI